VDAKRDSSQQAVAQTQSQTKEDRASPFSSRSPHGQLRALEHMFQSLPQRLTKQPSASPATMGLADASLSSHGMQHVPQSMQSGERGCIQGIGTQPDLRDSQISRSPSPSIGKPYSHDAFRLSFSPTGIPSAESALPQQAPISSTQAQHSSTQSDHKAAEAHEFEPQLAAFDEAEQTSAEAECSPAELASGTGAPDQALVMDAVSPSTAVVAGKASAALNDAVESLKAVPSDTSQDAVAAETDASEGLALSTPKVSLQDLAVSSDSKADVPMALADAASDGDSSGVYTAPKGATLHSPQIQPVLLQPGQTDTASSAEDLAVRGPPAVSATEAASAAAQAADMPSTAQPGENGLLNTQTDADKLLAQHTEQLDDPSGAEHAADLPSPHEALPTSLPHPSLSLPLPSTPMLAWLNALSTPGSGAMPARTPLPSSSPEPLLDQAPSALLTTDVPLPRQIASQASTPPDSTPSAAPSLKPPSTDVDAVVGPAGSGATAKHAGSGVSPNQATPEVWLRRAAPAMGLPTGLSGLTTPASAVEMHRYLHCMQTSAVRCSMLYIAADTMTKAVAGFCTVKLHTCRAWSACMYNSQPAPNVSRAQATESFARWNNFKHAEKHSTFVGI